MLTKRPAPGILSSTFHFPEMMLNLITRSPIYCATVHRLRERKRLTGHVPRVQGGELQDQEGEEDAFARGGRGGGECLRPASLSMRHQAGPGFAIAHVSVKE